jgi:hypothetical protein
MLRRDSGGWPVAILLLFGIATALIASGLPGESEHPGYYDGDDDDAGIPPSPLVLGLDIGAPAEPIRLPPAAPPTGAAPMPARSERAGLLAVGALAPRAPPA